MMRRGGVCTLWLIVTLVRAGAQAPDADSVRLRDRYGVVLQRDPYQDQAFERAYDAWFGTDGIDEWIARLESGPAKAMDHVLLARIYGRMFNPARALDHLDAAASLGEEGQEFNRLVGAVYFAAGRYGEAAERLGPIFESLTVPEDRLGVGRMLGSAYLRDNRRDQALEVWRRLSESPSADLYTLLDMADIYAENLLWPEFIAIHQRILDESPGDPQRQCRSLRAMGAARIRVDDYPGAIAAYQAALELVSPAHWMFGDIKEALIEVHERAGDLEGLAMYLRTRIELAPNAIAFRTMLADILVRLKQPADAETELRAILGRSPGEARAYESLIRLYDADGRGEEVVSSYEALIKAIPADPDYLRRLGEFYLSRGETQQAKDTWRRHPGNPPDAEGLARIAEWFEQYGLPDDAVACYEEALASRPNREWRFRLADLLEARGETARATELWLQDIEDPATDAASLLETVSALRAHHHDAEAEPVLRRAAELQPESLDTVAELADLLDRLERPGEALPLYARMAEQTENEFLRAKGEQGVLDIHRAKGELPALRTSLEDALAAEPDSPAALRKLARYHELTRDPAAAAPLYERWAALEPENLEPLRSLAETYASAHRPAEAVESYLKLIEQDRGRAAGYYRELAGLYDGLGRPEDALAASERVAALSPDDADARVELAAKYKEAGQAEKSFEQYRRALQSRLGDASVLQQFGAALSDAQRWGEATEAYRAILAGDSGRGARMDAIERLAELYQRQGRIEELVREFAGRVRLSPGNLDVHEELAAVYRSGGDPARAVEALESAADEVEDKEGALRALLGEAYGAGRLEAAVRAYERLVALSATPSIEDLVRLGGAYAKLNRTDEAIGAWTRITAEHSSDPGAWLAVAKAYEEEGMLDESFDARGRALELNRFDHPLRFDLAIDLAAEERYGEAIAELRAILDLGKDPAEAEREARAEPPSAERRPPVLGGRSRRAVRQWKGNFEQFRPEVVRTIVRFAQQSGATPQAMDGFRAKASAGNDLDATNDLLVAHLTARQWEPAGPVVEELLAARPDDVILLQQAAAIDQQLGRFDAAMKRMERVGELRLDQLTIVRYFMINAYIAEGRVEDAEDLVDRTLGEFPGDPAVMVQCASMLADGGRIERSIGLFKDALAHGAKSPSSIRMQLAQTYRTAGEAAAAMDTYAEIVLGPSTAAARTGRPRNSPLYIASLQAGGGQSISGIFARLNIPVDYLRVQALEQLDGLDTEGVAAAGTIERLIGAVRQADASGEDTVRAAAYDSGLLAAAALVDANNLERALEVLGLLAPMSPAGATDRQNLELMVLDRLERFDAMRESYAAIEAARIVPQASIDQARFQLALVADDFDGAESHIVALARAGSGTNAVAAAIEQLRRAGQRERCIRLIEEELAEPVRDAKLMTMLAGYYAEERRFDDAADMAREAWEAGTARQVAPGGSSKSARRGQARASELQQWYGYASQAGRAQSMIREFEARRDADPGDPGAYEDLIALYGMQGAQDRVVATFKALIALRPDAIQPRLSLAQQYQARGRIDEAIGLYEEALERQPKQAANISNTLHQLYRQANRADDAKRLEDRLAARATGPDELQNLAAFAMGRNDHAQALELYARALALEPAYVHLHMQMAQCHEQLQRPAEAVAEYRKYLDTMYARRSGQVDHHVLGRIVELEAGAGRLEALKAETAAALATNAMDMRARAFGFHIARREDRYADVLAEGEKLLAIQSDPAVVNLMVEMAESKGDQAAAIALLEAPHKGQPGDNERLARLHMKSGDTAKAMAAWTRQAVQEGEYGYARMLRNMVEAGYIDAAAEFFRLSRPGLKRDRGALEQFDSVLVEFSAKNAALKSLAFDLVLTPDNPFFENLARTMLQHEANQPKSERLVLAERLYRIEPGNAGIAEEYANMLEANGDTQKVVEVYRGVVEKNGDNDDAAARLVTSLIAAGSAEEAEAFARGRFEAAPSPASARTLAGCLADIHKAVELEALFDSFASQPAETAEDFRAAVLRHIQYRGNFEALIARAWREYPSGASFECLFAFLMDRNRRDEASRLLHDATARGIPTYSRENLQRIWRLALGH